MNQIKISIISGLIMASGLSFSQSKKALLAKIETQKQEIETLKAQVPSRNLATAIDTFSYSLGVDFYNNNLKSQGMDSLMSMNSFYVGLKDAELGSSTILNEDQRKSSIESVFSKMNAVKQAEMESQNKERDAQGLKNLEIGQAFLAENAKKSGVVSLPSGLQYKIIESGDKKGANPVESSEVTVFYEGKLIDGTVFDGNMDGESISFPLNGVIKGWTEIVQKMKKGDKWEVYIPADLAYGANGGGPIGPNETLIFIIKLVDFK